MAPRDAPAPSDVMAPSDAVTEPAAGDESRHPPARLARLGYVDATRSSRFLDDPLLAGLPDDLVVQFARTPDPDQGVLALLRLLEAADAAGASGDYQDLLATDDAARARLIAVLGGSVALCDVLTRHPERVAALGDAGDGVPPALDVDAAAVRAELLTAVGADPDADVPVAGVSGREAYDALRVSYAVRLVQIAAVDLTAEDPVEIQPDVSGALSDLADAALETALAIARAAVDGHQRVRLAVIAMGKCGARELNYISDVDVVYIAEPTNDADAGEAAGESEVAEIGAALARELARACSTVTAEGSLWQVDPNLRPEGKDGPLVRTLDSHRQYYRTWAKSWEFQALLKARGAAGDRALAGEFVALTRPRVWQASTRDGFVEDSQAMRRRVVANIPAAQADRNLKLGSGGLRDIEFTVQLLQMVHGRSDESLRAPATLTALAELRDGGYIGRADADALDGHYRFLRTVEHRLQLHRMRRTQVLPTAERDIRRLARALRDAPADFPKRIDRTRRDVTRLHENIYYRPLLVTASALTDDQVRLTPDAARERLAAIGYRDPQRALNHIEALTTGVTRRAAIQRQLMPALLEWFAEGIDPDSGLLAFRRLSDVIGRTHWYLAMLRDSRVAARRLTRVLSSSHFVGDELQRFPEAVRWLSDSRELAVRDREQLTAEFEKVLGRTDDLDAATRSLRRTRSRELLRIALAHTAGLIGLPDVGCALADLASAVLDGALRVAAAVVDRQDGDEATASDPGVAADPGVRLAVLGMGSFGAGEMGYASDADVQFVYEAVDGGAEDPAARAVALASTVQKLMNAPSTGPAMRVNADLRPDGRQGLLARSVDSFTTYYRAQAALWEKQALLRARPVAGDAGLGERLVGIIDPVRYPAGGLDAAQLRQVRRMKARIESERLPRGTEPTRHLKLGRGGMTDVEWVVQVLQMLHAHDHPALRVTRTLDALEALEAEGLLSGADGAALKEAWLTASAFRRALFLWKGRETAVLPKDRLDLAASAVLVDGPDATADDSEEAYLRSARRARHVAERLFYGEA